MPRDARVPPYQIVPGDKHNLTLGVMAAFLLGTCKSLPGLPPLARWQLNGGDYPQFPPACSCGTP